MSLIRWRPGQNLDRWDSFSTDVGNLRQEMDRLFSHLMVPGYDVESGESVFPSAEIQDQGDRLSLKLEVPGMKPEDVDIQVSADTVSITGERQSAEKNGRKRNDSLRISLWKVFAHHCTTENNQARRSGCQLYRWDSELNDAKRGKGKPINRSKSRLNNLR